MMYMPQKVTIHILKAILSLYFINSFIEVCDDVETEPCVQFLNVETFANRNATAEDVYKLDIKANFSQL